MSSTKGAFIVSKNTSEGNGSPCAADLANRSACSFSHVGLFFTDKPSKEAFILWTVLRYFSSYRSLALLLLSTLPVIICESDLRIVLLISIALSFRSPKRRALYSAMLFVQLNSSLAA
jgi:hypothetical protein